jgi:urease accessory protein UreF
MAGQTLLAGLHAAIESCARDASALGDDELGSATVHHAILSARHEAMYSRLYRS